MNVLIFHKTTDGDLEKGMQVAYKDNLGQYAKSGKIETINFMDGCRNYLIDGAAYVASELKLIEQIPANTYRELEIAVLIHKNFVEVTEKLFYEALEVLPPIWLNNGCFQVGECYRDDLYHTFGTRDDKYFGCLCNKNFALNNF